MKIEIIKDVYAVLTIDNDKTYKSTFNHLAKYPFSFKECNLGFGERFEDVALLKDGTVSFAFKYGKEKDFKILNFILKRDNPVVIEDTYTEWNRDLEKDIVHNLRFELHLEYKEVEVDENKLVLVINEFADDSSCEYYENGEEKRHILLNELKEGDIISANLLKKEQLRLKVTKIEKINIDLECLDFARRPTYPNTQIHSVTINQFFFAYFLEQGGYNTRYDYESWRWSFKLELNIKDAIKFIGE